MLTPEQIELRKSVIGGSEAPAALGYDPDKSKWDLWAEKTGKVDPFAGNDATRRGTWMEPALMMFAEHELGASLERDVFVRSTIFPNVAANLDAFWRQQTAPIEGKSTVKDEDWGEPGTDEVPRRVIIQVHAQMFCIGRESRMALVPMVVPGFKHFDFRMYHVDRDDRMATAIAERCQEFWDKYVVKDIPPDNSRPSMEIVKRMRREPNKVIDLPQSAAEKLHKLENAKKVQKAVKEIVERRQAAVLADLGDAEAGLLPDGRAITYMTTQRKGYTVKDTSFRQMRIKSGKEISHQQTQGVSQ